MRLLATVFASALGYAVAPALALPITNGDFETGTLAGWYSSSTTAIANGAAGYTPLAGNSSALIIAMSTAPVPPYSCSTDIWNINCPLPLPFAASGAPLPTHTNFGPLGVATAYFRGGYIGRDVSVLAGDKINWNWLALGEAVGTPSSVDRARFYATDGTIENWVDAPSGANSYQFPQGGTWSVYFGLYQSEDPYIYSALKLDSVSIQAVPEPATLWLLAGAVALGISFRRRLRIGMSTTT